MKTDKLTCEKARNISIVKTLENLGHFPKKKSKKEAWFLSPFRSETQASFKVDLRINRWYDHGIGKGGNIIDLVMELYKFSVYETLEFLSGNINSFLFHEQTNFQPKKEYQIDSIRELSTKALLQYLESRKIDLDIAKKYCKEIYYKIKNKTYFAIAFKNDSEGIEIRNKYFKGSLGKKDSTMLKNGSSALVVFEGFIDFLSYLTAYKNYKKNEDYLILNSISMVEQLTEKVENYNQIISCLDNDNSGIEATKLLKTKYENVMDCSFVFKNYNDFNEYLMDMN